MSYQRDAIHAPSAPKPNGNYSHVVRQGNTLHVGKSYALSFISSSLNLPISHPLPRKLYSTQTLYQSASSNSPTSNTFPTAGWMGDDPTTSLIVPGGITPQTHQAIANISACLSAAGSSLAKVVRRRIYIMDMKDFREVDRIWAEYFTEPFPVSTCVQVAGLAKEGALVELEVVAEA